VRQSIDAEMNQLDLCRLDVTICPSPAAIEFLTIVEQARQRDGLARLGEINRAINLDVRPVADIDQHQVEDYWSPPLATLTVGAGDCEDYAIAKFVALHEAGVASSDLRLVILRDQRLHADHAVVAVRIDHRWRILDSRRLQMLDDTQFLRFQTMWHFEPVFVIGDTGVRRYDDPPQLAASVAIMGPRF
jgi:predicted transglutaminase-like cysteine proteinase